MKQILLLIIVCFGILSCKKSEPISPGLFGKWELRRNYGGIAGFDSVYKAGNGNILQFSSDSTYKRFEAKKLTSTGAFHIKHFTDPAGNAIAEYVIFFDNNTYGAPFHMNGTSMTIGTSLADGVASDFQKISN